MKNASDAKYDILSDKDSSSHLVPLDTLPCRSAQYYTDSHNKLVSKLQFCGLNDGRKFCAFKRKGTTKDG